MMKRLCFGYTPMHKRFVDRFGGYFVIVVVAVFRKLKIACDIDTGMVMMAFSLLARIWENVQRFIPRLRLFFF